MFDHLALSIAWVSNLRNNNYLMLFAVTRHSGRHDDASFSDLIATGAKPPSTGNGLSTSWQIFGLTYDDCARL